jgi:hypothetical protein
VHLEFALGLDSHDRPKSLNGLDGLFKVGMFEEAHMMTLQTKVGG